MGCEKELFHYVKKINFITAHVKKLQQRLHAKELKVLDIGCGTGNISLAIAGLGCNVIGFDLDKESIAYARKRIKKGMRCRFFIGNAHELKIKERFDIIICSEVLEHLKNPESLLKFISENLDKRGFLYLSVPHGYGPAEISVMPRRIIGRVLKKLGLYESARKIRHCIIRNPMQKARKSFGVDTLNNSGEGALHAQFFSLRKLKRMLMKYHLQIKERQNTYVLLGTFPFYYLFAKSRKLQIMDCKIADFMPGLFVSGWGFIVEKADN